MATPAGGKGFDPGIIQYVANGMRGARKAGAPGFILGITGQEWFGPLQPTEPVTPPGMDPRVLDYPMGVNLQYQPRALENGITYAQLEMLADGYDLLRLVIETRKDQVCKMPWGLRVVPKQGEKKADAKARTDKDPRIALLTEFFRSPDRIHDWQTWLRLILEDLFVIDAPAILVRRREDNTLWGFEPIHGATITRLIDDQGRTPLPPSPGFRQILKGVPGPFLYNGFTGNKELPELMYRPRNARPRRMYGYSPVEQIIVTVNMALRRQISQLSYYTEGNIPEALVSLPESWTADQIKKWQDQFDIYAGDVGQKRRIRWVPEIKAFYGTKDAMLKDEFDEWLARIICFNFSISPQPFVKMMNRSTAATAQQTALSEGLIPLLEWIKAMINELLHTYVPGTEDIEWSFDEAEESDKLKQSMIDKNRVSIGIDSVDEIRERDGLDPIGCHNFVLTGSGPIFLKDVIAASEAGVGAGSPGALAAATAAASAKNGGGNGGTGGGESTSKALAIRKEYDESLHPRDETGKWTDGGIAGLDNIPASRMVQDTPAEVPAGMIHLYHFTGGEGLEDTRGNLASIVKNGIRQDRAKGETYGEPSVVWGSTEKPRDFKEYVEFWVKPEDIGIGKPYPSEYGKPLSQKDITEFNAGNHDVTINGNVAPSQILRVHEDWHTSYQYVAQEPSLQREVKEGKMGYLLDPTSRFYNDKDSIGLRRWIRDNPDFAPPVSKFNPNHDEKTGQFTSGDGGGQGSFGFPKDRGTVPQIEVQRHGGGPLAHRSPEEEKLITGTVESEKNLGGGVNETQIITFEDGSKAVFKPVSGESGQMRDNIEPGMSTEREVAAWETAKLVGMDDLATPAVERELDGERGVLLAWKDGDQAVNVGKPFDGYTDAARSAAFDFVIGNEDRHQKNWMVDGDQIHLIDHGLSFPEGYAEVDRGFLPYIRAEESAGGSNTKASIPSPRSLAAAYVKAEPQIVATMRGLGLPESAVTGVQDRITILSKADHWSQVPIVSGNRGGTFGGGSDPSTSHGGTDHWSSGDRGGGSSDPRSADGADE